MPAITIRTTQGRAVRTRYGWVWSCTTCWGMPVTLGLAEGEDVNGYLDGIDAAHRCPDKRGRGT